jgi:ABC-type nitrate/sulfonate/bicarbonate transport system, permease component
MTTPQLRVKAPAASDGSERKVKAEDSGWPAKRIGLNVLSIVAVLILWHVAATLQENIMFPTPLASGEALVSLLAEDEGRGHILITLGRVALGFAFGCIGGVLIGSIFGSIPVIAAALEPVIHFLRSVTPIAWIVPATIWLGVGEGPLRFIVIYATVFPVILNTISGMASTSKNKIRMARTFGAGRFRIYWSVMLPSAVPQIATGMRLALGYSFMSVVAAEMVAGSSGIGFFIYRARVFFDTPTMFAGIVILGLAGILFDRLFVVASATVLRSFYSGQVST